MDGAAPTGPLGGEGKFVEVDETYVGGKTTNKHANKRTGNKGPQATGKAPVVSLIERGGNVRSFHVANVTGATLRAAIVQNVDRKSWLMTDEHNGYKAVGAEFKAHSSTNHSRGEYARGGFVHSNTVENFFSIFKRGVIGTYHHLSEAHLNRYLAEFDMRRNTRDMTDGERAAVILKGGEGRRLTYRRAGAIAA
jgi:transposase-like protein